MDTSGHEERRLFQAEMDRLTVILSALGGQSYLRLGDCEILFMLDRQRRLTGLAPEHYERLVNAYANCTYLDLCANQKLNHHVLSKLPFRRATGVFTLDDAICGNLMRHWAYWELHDFLQHRRCLFAGAEAELLKHLYANPDYRAITRQFWPQTGEVFFLKTANDGSLVKDLDKIKSDIVRLVDDHRLDAVFLSLGGGAKIICHEVATEKGITMVDFGSIMRALAYTPIRGDTLEPDYCFWYGCRIPFHMVMEAFDKANPGLGDLKRLQVAQAQAKLDLNQRVPREGDIKLCVAPENRRDFHESVGHYNRLYRPLTLNNWRCFRAAMTFELFRFRIDHPLHLRRRCKSAIMWLFRLLPPRPR